MGTAITLGEGISLVITLLENASKISALIQAAQAAGQKNLDESAWAAIKGTDDTAMALLAKQLGIGVPPVTG